LIFKLSPLNKDSCNFEVNDVHIFVVLGRIDEEYPGLPSEAVAVMCDCVKDELRELYREIVASYGDAETFLDVLQHKYELLYFCQKGLNKLGLDDERLYQHACLHLGGSILELLIGRVHANVTNERAKGLGPNSRKTYINAIRAAGAESAARALRALNQQIMSPSGDNDTYVAEDLSKVLEKVAPAAAEAHGFVKTPDKRMEKSFLADRRGRSEVDLRRFQGGGLLDVRNFIAGVVTYKSLAKHSAFVDFPQEKWIADVVVALFADDGDLLGALKGALAAPTPESFDAVISLVLP
jgi:hypothetical protein